MSASMAAELENKLAQLLDTDIPAHPTQDINAALQLSDTMQAKGFAFKLKDLCPKSLSETMWRAVFSKSGMDFKAEAPDSALAVCAAAVEALENNK